MAFLNSLFLLGLTAAILPILIHLLSRQKARRLLFGSLDFIRRLEERRRRRFRLTQLLLLALRVLLLALIAVGFARPTLRHSIFGAAGAGRTAAAIVLDASASMGAEGPDGSRIEAARRRASEILDLLTDQDEAALLLASSLPRAATPALSRSRDLVRAELARAAPTAAASDLSGALRDAALLLTEARAPNREVYVISDFQKNLVPESGLGVTLPEGTRTYLVPVGRDDAGNAAVTGASWREERLGSGNVRVEADVARYGGDGALEVVAALSMDGAEVERRLVALEPGEARTIAFSARVPGRGYHRGVVTIDARDLAADNERPFVVGLSEGMRVLVADGRSPSDRASAYHVARALAPDPAAGGFFQVTRVGLAEQALPDLATHGAVVLAEAARLAPSDLERLGAYVERGGGVLVLPGRTLDAAFYATELLPRLGLDARLGTPPVEFPGSFARIDQIAEAHPIFALFGEHRDRLFRDTKVYRYFPVEASAGARPIARFGGGAPALLEAGRPSGGRVLLATLPFDPEWTSLPRDAAFLPIVHEAVKYLARSESPEEVNLVVGTPYRRLVRELAAGATIAAVAPDGRESLVSARPDAEGLVAEVRDTALPGFHLLRTPDGEFPFAVAVDPAESDLARLSDAEIAEAFPDARVVRAAAEVRRAVLTGRFGREYWHEILLLALVVALAESLLGRGAARPAAADTKERRAA